jgi:hypothetical protein
MISLVRFRGRITGLGLLWSEPLERRGKKGCWRRCGWEWEICKEFGDITEKYGRFLSLDSHSRSCCLLAVLEAFP